MSKASERVKRWRKANPEKYREQRRTRYASSPEFRESERARGREYKKTETAKKLRTASREKNREHENALSSVAKKRRLRSDPRKSMLSSAKHRAARNGVPFALTINDMHVPATCPLLGIPLLVNDKILGPNSPTLDRVLNSRGYVPGNVIVISYAANRCKGNLHADDIIKLGMNLKFLEAFRAPS